jgi:hypothetical protein
MAKNAQDKPVDMVWLLRGGAADVYTLISNLSRLQKFFPNNHLSECNPYILADSAGAYPGAGLVSPKQVDPTKLPEIFKKRIGDYLAKDRRIAEKALIEEIGPMRVKESRTPICISTTDVTNGLKKSYFRYFPESYKESHPGIILPANNNSHVPMSKAVMASSAFPFFLGDYKIGAKRYIDMSFLETHSSSLIEFVFNHARSCPDRRLICVIFGNNYSDLRLSPKDNLELKKMNEHFGDAIRSYIQNDLSQLTKTLFGPKNVFDLSIYIERPISVKNNQALPHAFRSDPLAVRERIFWTDEFLDNNDKHAETLRKLAEIIRRGVLPAAKFEPASYRLKQADSWPERTLPLTKIEKITSITADYRIAAGPRVRAGLEMIKGALDFPTSWLKNEWRQKTPFIWKALVPNHPFEEETPSKTTPPSPRHS